ncbi:MAG: N-succinyldiaminopimelate aminotransferase [Gammaproteobacteria bacterium]|jgi:N-succinyldiaminopimelate aminotransferase
MNPGLALLQPYPFERLAQLRASIDPPSNLEPINLSIGEPKHPTPQFIRDALVESLAGTEKYPPTRGSDGLRESIGTWLRKRFKLPAASLDPNTEVLPVNGTREALFSIAQCLVDRDAAKPLVAMPNPFYQIYEGAAHLAGAVPYYVACPADREFLPAFEEVPNKVWDDCQLVYICTPGNPSGRVMDSGQIAGLIELADRHDFTIVSDECYSELYLDETKPPVGLLQVAAALGRTDFRRCLVMHSLSKRSNAPGLRSGFVAGDAQLIHAFLRYRTYHGCAMPLHVQAASLAAWQDEAHVQENRRLYRAKFRAVIPILAEHMRIPEPEAGFYLWPQLDMDDIDLCRALIAEQNVITLPGRYLARPDSNGNPGQNRLRIVLTEKIEQCIAGAERIATLLHNR